MPMTGITAVDQMGGPVTRRCACGNFGSSGDTRGRRRSRSHRRKHRRRRSVSVKRAGFYVTGP